MADVIFDDGSPIDSDKLMQLAKEFDYASDRLIKLIWKQAKGDNKVVNSMNGKRLQVVAGVVQQDNRRDTNNRISINVKFAQPFSGKHPTVVAMPESDSAYGVSVREIDHNGFVLVLRQQDDDSLFPLTAIHYIAVGMP